VPNWDDQGQQYAAFIEAQLAAENDRRASVNTRAATILTGSAALVTLVFAVFAVLAGKNFTLSANAPGHPREWLEGALAALFFAALFALLAGVPWTTSVPPLHLLHSFLEVPNESAGLPWGWTNEEVDAREWTAKSNLRTIKSLRSGTKLKYVLLIIATVLQLVALFCLAVCARAVVDVHPPPDGGDHSGQQPPAVTGTVTSIVTGTVTVTVVGTPSLQPKADP
jgi:hypothetical protein